MRKLKSKTTKPPLKRWSSLQASFCCAHKAAALKISKLGETFWTKYHGVRAPAARTKASRAKGNNRRCASKKSQSGPRPQGTSARRARSHTDSRALQRGPSIRALSSKASNPPIADSRKSGFTANPKAAHDLFMQHASFLHCPPEGHGAALLNEAVGMGKEGAPAQPKPGQERRSWCSPDVLEAVTLNPISLTLTPRGLALNPRVLNLNPEVLALWSFLNLFGAF